MNVTRQTWELLRDYQLDLMVVGLAALLGYGERATTWANLRRDERRQNR